MNILILVMMTVGALFILIAAIGLVRMPDFYLRLTVTVKAATFGIGFILGGAAIYFNNFSFTTKVFAIIFFLILTAPVAGHLIGRTAYKSGVKLWKNSVIDDLANKKDTLPQQKQIIEIIQEEDQDGENKKED